MKIREGFVSNSSSSSFIIITTENYNWQDKVEDESLVKLYEDAFTPSKEKFNGQEIKVYEGWADTSCGENTVYFSSAFNEYCEENNINEDNACVEAERLYFNFSTYFNSKECFVKTME